MSDLATIIARVGDCQAVYDAALEREKTTHQELVRVREVVVGAAKALNVAKLELLRAAGASVSYWQFGLDEAKLEDRTGIMVGHADVGHT